MLGQVRPVYCRFGQVKACYARLEYVRLGETILAQVRQCYFM